MAGELSAGSVVGSYRIESLVGRGGMGVVYRAQHTRLKRLAALKVLAPEWADDADFRERFERESELAAHVDHPNIIPVYDAGEAEGLLYIAMRFVDGTDLRALLDREGPLTASRALDLLEKVAAGLDAAHRRDLVHRDVKPGNVMIEHPGDAEAEHVFLTDFGLVKRVGAPQSVTRTGYFVGTVDYAAPEQFRGEELDGRADQYALGCVLYQCLTGQPPFPRDDDAATMFAHLSDPPPSLAESTGAPAALEPVLAQAMAKSRDDRFPTCTAFAQAARGALAEASAGATEPFTAHTQLAPPPIPPPPTPAKPSVPPSFVQPPRPKPTRPAKPPRPPKQDKAQKERPPKRRRRVLVAACVVIVLMGAAVGAIALAGGHKGGANPAPPITTTPPTTSTPPPVGPTLLASSFLDGGLDPVAASGPHQLGPETISGFPFSHSLAYTLTGAGGEDFSTTYDLKRGFRTFTATVGFKPTLGSGCDRVGFELVADDTTDSKTVFAGPGKIFSLDVSDVKRLELRTTSSEDCPGVAVWGNAAVLGSGPTPSAAGSPEVSPAPDQLLGKLDFAPETQIPTPHLGPSPKISGQSFPHSLTYDFSGAGSEEFSTTYDLAGGYQTLTATLAFSPTPGSGCRSITFDVVTDVNTHHPFTVFAGRNHSLSLPVANIGQIELRTTSDEDCPGTAVWGDAQVHGAG